MTWRLGLHTALHLYTRKDITHHNTMFYNLSHNLPSDMARGYADHLRLQGSWLTKMTCEGKNDVFMSFHYFTFASMSFNYLFSSSYLHLIVPTCSYIHLYATFILVGRVFMFFLWSYVTWGAWDLGQNLGYVICQVGSKRMPMSPEPSVYYKINTYIYIYTLQYIYIYGTPPKNLCTLWFYCYLQ